MRRGVLAALLLLAAAPAFSAPSREELRRRTLALLHEIQAQAASAHKDTAVLRAELQALEKDNSLSPDDKVGAHLREAEADLALMDKGVQLPTPLDESDISDDLPDRDAVASPALPLPAPIYQNIGAAELPESAGAIFDGSLRHGGLAGGAVEVPAPAADLNDYLELEDDDDRLDFLEKASGDLLKKLGEPDEDGARAEFLAGKLMKTIESHPDRAEFATLSVVAMKDGKLYLKYTLRSGKEVNQELGKTKEWTTPKHGGGGGHGGHGGGGHGGHGGGHKGKGGKGGAGGDDEEGGDDKPGGHKGKGGGGEGDGDEGGGSGGKLGKSHSKKKGFHPPVPSPPLPRAGRAAVPLAQAKAPGSASPVPLHGAPAPDLKAPSTSDEDLHDAVAAHAAVAPSPAASSKAAAAPPETAAAPESASEPPSNSWALTLACAVGAAVGAYALFRSRTV
ncbi:MAG: hypothetical protein ACHQ2Z_08270 [Elusimicrobiota bacterium]